MVKIKISAIFAPKLKESRKSHGFTQKEISEEIGITRTSLCNYETGAREPDIETLAQLSEFYGISTDFLIGITMDKSFIEWSFEEKAPLSKWNGRKIKTTCFPERLRIARAKKNLSQYKVANKLNIKRSSIAKYELGKAQPSIETLARLCIFYDVRANWLLGLEDDARFTDEESNQKGEQ